MTIQNEIGFPQYILDQLHQIGHNSTIYTGIGSAVTALAKQNKYITAISDYRRQGKTAGF